IDRIYMTSMQALGMGGGWPLNVFLTPELQPFYGGTYFPPHSFQGRPGMSDLLPRVAEAWREHRADLVKTGEQVLSALAGMTKSGGSVVDRTKLMTQAYEGLARGYDAELGGFGQAPKFPTTVNLSFLFRWWARDPATRGHARTMALRQLD